MLGVWWSLIMRFMRNKAEQKGPGLYAYIYMYSMQPFMLNKAYGIWDSFTLVNWICTQYLWRIQYIIYVEPVCLPFCGLNPAKQGPFQSRQNKGHLNCRYVHHVVFHCYWRVYFWLFYNAPPQTSNPKFAIPSLAAPRFRARGGIVEEDLRKSTCGMVTIGFP